MTLPIILSKPLRYDPEFPSFKSAPKFTFQSKFDTDYLGPTNLKQNPGKRDYSSMRERTAI